MAENLKVTRYRNGDPIPNVTSASEWSNLRTGAYYNYDNNISNVATYGRLYNWYMINDRRNIAPKGWHVPKKDELEILADYLGGYRYADRKMKEQGTAHWKGQNEFATNSSGFSTLPAGYRYSDGVFNDMGFEAAFWYAMKNYSLTAWRSRLYLDINNEQYNINKRYGFSVRCIKD